MKKDAVKNRPTIPGLCDDGLMGAGLIVLNSQECRMMGMGGRF